MAPNEPKNNETVASPPIISLTDVTFAYGETEAPILSKVNLAFPRGQTIAIVGPNGSGKSTLLRLICGILIPLDGTIKINGTQVNDDNARDLLGKNIGMVFQNPDSQFIGATVRDDLAFGLENDKVPAAKMTPLIEKFARLVDVFDRLDDEPSKLSGGQKQRVALAGVLLRKPKILLLDEATSMLDPLAKQEIETLITAVKAQQQDLTILKVTHEASEASQADLLIALDKGQVVFQGLPQTIFASREKTVKLGLKPLFATELQQAFKDSNIAVDTFNDPETLARLLWK